MLNKKDFALKESSRLFDINHPPGGSETEVAVFCLVSFLFTIEKQAIACFSKSNFASTKLRNLFGNNEIMVAVFFSLTTNRETEQASKP